MNFGIACNRCNEIFNQPKRCQLSECSYPAYFEDIRRRFGNNIPPKYYISLIGGINAGKTIYLLSLLDIINSRDEALRNLLKKYAIRSFEIIDKVSWELYDKIMERYKLGADFGTLPTSPLGSFNIILTLENGQAYELVMFNTSGEKIEHAFTSRKVTGAHELQGAAFIYFLDPREDKGINKLLSSPKGLSPANYNMTDYLHNVMQVVNKGVQIVRNPLAICISKFDLLKHRIPFDLPEATYVEAGRDNFFLAIDKVSQKLEIFLKKESKAVNVNDVKEKFHSHKYFTVAPFGKDTKPAYWHDKDPKGILAPFFWLLKELQLITESHGNYK